MSIADLATSYNEKIGAITTLIEQHRHNASQNFEKFKRAASDAGTDKARYEEMKAEALRFQVMEAEFKILALEVKQVLES